MAAIYTEGFEKYIAGIDPLLLKLGRQDPWDAKQAYLLLCVGPREAGTRNGHHLILRWVAGMIQKKSIKLALTAVALDWHWEGTESLGDNRVYDPSHPAWWDKTAEVQGVKTLDQWREIWTRDGAPMWDMEGKYLPGKDKKSIFQIKDIIAILEEALDRYKKGFYSFGLGWVSVHPKKKDGVPVLSDNGLPKLASVPESWFVYGHDTHASSWLSKPKGFTPKVIKAILRDDRLTWDVYMLSEVVTTTVVTVTTGSAQQFTKIASACILYQVPDWVALETRSGGAVAIDEGRIQVGA